MDIKRIKDLLQIDRERAMTLGQEILRIIKAGRYRAPSGRIVEVASLISAAVKGTVSYPPGREPAPVKPGSFATKIEVINDTTLDAVIRLKVRDLSPAVLNMASAESPGGGFLIGARAQEEYLCRSSALWACLEKNPMYAFHIKRGDPFYTDYVIFSPNVPVMRTDDHAFLEKPYLASFLTSPAVYASGVVTSMKARAGEIGPVMEKRIHKLLAVAAAHGQTCLVLGAWGCGAFGNDGRLIAGLFRDALQGEFRGVFQEIVFAITDWSDERRFIKPFEEAFAGLR
jgi:uncharacterized protein (TIGR02452 family)